MTDEETKARELKAKQQAEQIARKYRDVFETVAGQVVLADLIQTFGFNEQVFKPVRREEHFAYDPLTAALSDGARGVLIHIRKQLASKDGEEKKKGKVVR